MTHHEKWDGSGYPHGLTEYAIPLTGRIVTICDVFDALTSKRPYKEAWPLSDALNEIRACSGTAFDPKLVECFFKCLPNLINTIDNFQNESQGQAIARFTDAENAGGKPGVLQIGATS